MIPLIIIITTAMKQQYLLAKPYVRSIKTCKGEKLVQNDNYV